MSYSNSNISNSWWQWFQPISLTLVCVINVPHPDCAHLEEGLALDPSALIETPMAQRTNAQFVRLMGCWTNGKFSCSQAPQGGQLSSDLYLSVPVGLCSVQAAGWKWRRFVSRMASRPRFAERMPVPSIHCRAVEQRESEPAREWRQSSEARQGTPLNQEISHRLRQDVFLFNK